MTTWPVHGRISGPSVMIGFGSIGQGTLPLIERHFEYDKSRFVVIDPQEKHKELLDERGIRFIQTGLTHENYREVLTPLQLLGGRSPQARGLPAPVAGRPHRLLDAFAVPPG